MEPTLKFRRGCLKGTLVVHRSIGLCKCID